MSAEGSTDVEVDDRKGGVEERVGYDDEDESGLQNYHNTTTRILNSVDSNSCSSSSKGIEKEDDNDGHEEDDDDDGNGDGVEEGSSNKPNVRPSFTALFFRGVDDEADPEGGRKGFTPLILIDNNKSDDKNNNSNHNDAVSPLPLHQSGHQQLGGRKSDRQEERTFPPRLSRCYFCPLFGGVCCLLVFVDDAELRAEWRWRLWRVSGGFNASGQLSDASFSSSSSSNEERQETGKPPPPPSPLLT